MNNYRLYAKLFHKPDSSNLSAVPCEVENGNYRAEFKNRFFLNSRVLFMIAMKVFYHHKDFESYYSARMNVEVYDGSL